jgi:hypothetical protein
MAGFCRQGKAAVASKTGVYQGADTHLVVRNPGRARAPRFDAHDYATALKAWRPLAVKGDVRAQTMLGVMCRDARGMAKNCREAAKWIRLAAQQQYAPAQYELGLMFYKGQGVPQKYTESAKYWWMAAEQGYAPAQYRLGMLSFVGRGVPCCYVECYKWLSLALRQGEGQAAKALEELGRQMSPSQIADAQTLIAAFRPQPSPVTAAEPLPLPHQ